MALLLFARTATAVQVQYSYDSLNRLTAVDYGNGSVISYTYDAAGNRLTYSGVVTNDVIAPSITITNPTSSSSFTTSAATINLSGTATDNVAVTLVTWANDQGGIGTASGTTSWSINGVHLQNGTNFIWVTAYDAVGNNMAAMLTVVSSSEVNVNRIIGLSGNVAFENVQVGSTATRTLTISNSGDSVLTVSGISYPSGFSGAFSGTVAAGGSQNVSVTFTPAAAIAYGGTLTVNSDKTSGSNTIMASGSGVLTPTALTNATARIGDLQIVLAGATNQFTASGVDASGNPVSCFWDFGDGNTSTECNPSHVYTNCQPFTVTHTATNSLTASATNFVVSVPCELAVTSLQAKMNFARPNADSCKVKAIPQPSQCTNWLGTVVTLDVGDAQVSFTLNAKGRGVSTNGTCRFSYNKRTGACTFTANLSHGSWLGVWDGYGLVNATVAKPGTSVTLPVILLIGDEAFMAEKPLHYTAKWHKSGTAK